MHTQILSGKEPFIYQSKPIPATIKDFWAWNSSNLLSNTLRGALAEYIVAQALEIYLPYARDDWTEYDLRYGSKRIEVKSSAYLQAWDQIKLSDIRFSIAEARSWTSAQHYDDNQIRHSDIYIFCLYECTERANADVMRLDDWVFYVLQTKIINETLGSQRSIGLKSLLAMNPRTARFGELKAIIDSIP